MFFLILISCNLKTSNVLISAELIDSISAETIKFKTGQHVKVRYIHMPVFVRFNDTSFVKTNSDEIYYIYETSYKASFDRYNAFLYEVINNGFKLNKNDFDEKTFSLNNVINKKFKQTETKDFLNYYSIKDSSEDKPYLNKKIKTENEYLTISYLLFTKGYYLGSDDLRGRSYVYRFDGNVGNVPN